MILYPYILLNITMNDIIRIFWSYKWALNRKDFVTGLFLLWGLHIIPKILELSWFNTNSDVYIFTNLWIIIISILFWFLFCIKRFRDLWKKGYNTLYVMMPIIWYFVLLYLLLTKGWNQKNKQKNWLLDYISVVILFSINVLLYIYAYNYYSDYTMNIINEQRDDIRFDNLMNISDIIDDYYWEYREYPSVDALRKFLSNHNYNDPWFWKTVNGCKYWYLYEVNKNKWYYRVSSCLWSKLKQEWYSRPDLFQFIEFRNKAVLNNLSSIWEPNFIAIDIGFLDIKKEK